MSERDALPDDVTQLIDALASRAVSGCWGEGQINSDITEVVCRALALGREQGRQEADQAEATLARVRALPAKWRTEAATEQRVSFCADDLAVALRGVEEPK